MHIDVEKKSVQTLYEKREGKSAVRFSKSIRPRKIVTIPVIELMGNFGLVDSFEYNIEVMYDKERNEWCVSFKNKNINYLDSSATIWLSRSYGVMNDFRQ